MATELKGVDDLEEGSKYVVHYLPHRIEDNDDKAATFTGVFLGYTVLNGRQTPHGPCHNHLMVRFQCWDKKHQEYENQLTYKCITTILKAN